MIAVKEGVIEPVMVSFQQGLDQKFKQPSGTGIDFSMFEETELMQESDIKVCPLLVKAGAYPLDHSQSEGNLTGNSQITQAVFEKEKGVQQVRVVKQILWAEGMRYELQEIFGIGNSVDDNADGTDPGKECVICLSEPRDTTVLPCRHMVYNNSISFFIFPLSANFFFSSVLTGKGVNRQSFHWLKQGCQTDSMPLVSFVSWSECASISNYYQQLGFGDHWIDV